MNTEFTVGIERDISDKAPGFREQISRLAGDHRFDLRFLDRSEPAGSNVFSAGELADLDMLILMGRRRIEASSLEGAPRLKWIGRFGAGFDTVDLDACTACGVIVSNAPEGIQQSVAELVTAYALALATRLTFFDRYIREHGFAGKAEHTTQCIAGRTLGVIGCGGIAQRVVQLVKPFQIDLIAYDPYADHAAMKANGIELVGLEYLLRSSDIVSVHVPLTSSTEGMLTEQHFRMMKSSAHFINTSRGRIYSDAVLARVLNEGVIAGAAVDVFEDEPDVERNPLLACRRVVLTPHVAGTANNIHAIAEVMRSLVDSILKIAGGELPGSIVNPEAVGREVPAAQVSPSFRAGEMG